MAINRNILALVVAGLLAYPGAVDADQCDDIFAQGAGKFDAAIAAGKKDDFEVAIKLYGEAEKYYQQVTAMQGCHLQQITVTAARNVGICRSNASKIKQGLAKVQAYNKEMVVADTYNQAANDYNRGVTAFNNNEWDTASDALESAAAIWESIASSQTKYGKMAAQYAKKSRKMAELARQYKYK